MTDFYDQTQRLYITKDSGIGRLVLNRPDKYNALTMAMWQAIPAYLAALDSDPDVRVVIVTSSTPKAFCTGADIAEMGEIALDEKLREENRIALRDAQRVLARLHKPTIAQISGACFGGGCGIALHCDLRFASTDSKFGITPAKLGLVYPLNDTKTLVDLIGPSHAKRILFTASTILPDEALKIGMIDGLYAPDELEAATLEFAAKMAAVSQYSLRGMKKFIRRIMDGQVDDDADTAIIFTDAHDSIDYSEGIAAFMAKRKPDFKWNG